MTVKEYVEELMDFAIFVAKEIFDEDWDTNNKDAFAEIACRKLVKLGIVKKLENEYVYEEEK